MTDKGRFHLLAKSFVGVSGRFAPFVIPCAVLACNVASAGAGFAADNGSQVEVGKALGETGTGMPSGVYRAGLPRTDLKATLDGVALKAGFAFADWLAFERIGGQGMVMRAVVQTEDEFNPVMAKLAAAGIDQALGAEGQNVGGVYQFSFRRAEVIRDRGMAVPPAIGSAIGINFQPTRGGKPAITGDFVLIGSEVNPVLKAPSEHGIEVTAIHNHMLDDEPYLYFMHFWANDDAVKLAEGLKTALAQINIAKSRPVFALAVLLAAGLLMPAPAMAETAGAPLVLEAKIPLGAIRGRIDHLGVDLKRQRLFAAEFGNDSLGVVDLAAAKVRRTIAGFREPQGVAYVPFADSVYVASAGDGSVRVLRGDDLTPIGRIDLGDDADNVRADDLHRRVLVGYGSGALALIDTATQAKAGAIRLKGHPESFQIDETGRRVFINVPDAREIDVVNLATGGSRSLPLRGMQANFPMAIDRDTHRILIVFRNPPTLMALSSQDGRVVAKAATCGDADDVFVDARRRRLYVSCGEGAVDVFAAEGDGYRRLARVPTVPGARTSLFVPERDRLYVAVRASRDEPAAIWVFRPIP